MVIVVEVGQEVAVLHVGQHDQRRLLLVHAHGQQTHHVIMPEVLHHPRLLQERRHVHLLLIALYNDKRVVRRREDGLRVCA